MTRVNLILEAIVPVSLCTGESDARKITCRGDCRPSGAVAERERNGGNPSGYRRGQYQCQHWLGGWGKPFAEANLGRKLVWLVCDPHTGELGLMHLVASLDGPTFSSNRWAAAGVSDGPGNQSQLLPDHHCSSFDRAQ